MLVDQFLDLPTNAPFEIALARSRNL